METSPTGLFKPLAVVIGQLCRQGTPQVRVLRCLSVCKIVRMALLGLLPSPLIYSRNGERRGLTAAA